jgi:hypothetical protein
MRHQLMDVSPVRTDRHPVTMTPKAGGDLEYCTIEYAIDRLTPWWQGINVEKTLRRGVTLDTLGFWYEINER